MKMFYFDPSTGRRAGFIKDVKRADWCAESVEFAIKQGNIPNILNDVVIPRPRSGVKHTVHMNSGTYDAEYNSVSYLHDTNWVCFCLGQWFCGTEDKTGTWEWVILPPKSLVEDAL